MFVHSSKPIGKVTYRELYLWHLVVGEGAVAQDAGGAALLVQLLPQFNRVLAVVEPPAETCGRRETVHTAANLQHNQSITLHNISYLTFIADPIFAP